MTDADRVPAGATPAVEVLRRWSDAGGLWRVVERRDATVTVALLTCTAGEEVDRFTWAADPALLTFLARPPS